MRLRSAQRISSCGPLGKRLRALTAKRFRLPALSQSTNLAPRPERSGPIFGCPSPGRAFDRSKVHDSVSTERFTKIRTPTGPRRGSAGAFVLIFIQKGGPTTDDPLKHVMIAGNCHKFQIHRLPIVWALFPCFERLPGFDLAHSSCRPPARRAFGKRPAPLTLARRFHV